MLEVRFKTVSEHPSISQSLAGKSLLFIPLTGFQTNLFISKQGNTLSNTHTYVKRYVCLNPVSRTINGQIYPVNNGTMAGYLYNSGSSYSLGLETIGPYDLCIKG